MDYAADAISRVGLVTAPRVSEWQALGRRQEIIDLARLSNRYCLTLWCWWASLILVYGRSLCRIWIDRDFADNVAPLIPFFAIAYTLFMGQFISAAVLMGIGRYRAYSIALLCESLISVGSMSFLVPRFGLVAGVAGISCMIAITRWFTLSLLFAKEFEISQFLYLWSIFRKPAVLMGVSVLLLLLCQRFVWPGQSLQELFKTVVLFSVFYASGAFFFVIEKDQQQWILSKTTLLWNRFAS